MVRSSGSLALSVILLSSLLLVLALTLALLGSTVLVPQGGPVVVMVWEANNAIDIVRATIGATSPAEAAPGTIRGDLGLDIGRNLIHASDGPETAQTEVNLFFDETELVTWERDTDGWIFE